MCEYLRSLPGNMNLVGLDVREDQNCQYDEFYNVACSKCGCKEVCKYSETLKLLFQSGAVIDRVSYCKKYIESYGGGDHAQTPHAKAAEPELMTTDSDNATP